MIEKVNPMHPDKVADRIAGALVDHAYTLDKEPKVAFEVLLGHGEVYIIAETSVKLHRAAVESIVQRIAGDVKAVIYNEVPQDPALNKNQDEKLRCGDNGIFKGVPVSREVAKLSSIARDIHGEIGTDGKYILDDKRLIICQSNASRSVLEHLAARQGDYDVTINPLGDWTGGINVDTGAVNRKLGSDMGEAVTGGGLHGKDLSKADVSINIYCHLLAQEQGRVVQVSCAIGDEKVDGVNYEQIVKRAADYINELGGFERLAEWGLV